MSDLIRPEPPPDWRARLAGVATAGRAGRVAGALLTVAATAAAAVWLLRAPAPPVESTLPPARPLAVATTLVVTTVAPATTLPAEVVVQAAGAVVQPGVYRLPAGARVADLITAAGGVAGDADPGAVLLAAVLVDGERVYVPRVGEVAPAGPATTSAPANPATGTDGPAGPVNLNTASATELDALPGVGPATAAAIIERRATAGPYVVVDDLLDVPGIGPTKFERLRPLVTV